MKFEHSIDVWAVSEPLMEKCRRIGNLTLAVMTTGCLALTSVSRASQPSPPSNIVDLQLSKQISTTSISGTDSHGKATLINLNMRINTWYVLALEFTKENRIEYFHLENPAPLHQTLSLDQQTQLGIVINTDLDAFFCELWTDRSAILLDQARRSGVSFAPLCEGRIYLRNNVGGYRTKRELFAEVLRDKVWGGEKIIELVKDQLLKDAHLERAAPGTIEATMDAASVPGWPLPALTDSMQGQRAQPPGLGIAIDLPTPGAVTYGQWYAVLGVPDVYVSVMQPGLVPRSLLSSYRDRVKPLDDVESVALVYLLAIDLAQFDLAYEVGTDHPRVGWSERSHPSIRDPAMPGPDGFDTVEPLTRTGIVNPVHVSRTVATFTGGFKRSHGAFRNGELALNNRGSHYGWIQNGVVFSSLQPGLATVTVRDDGFVEMSTWQASNPWLHGVIRHARQNGVPLIEPDPASGDPVPGTLVGVWSAGNWSGSASGQQRSVRAGLCLQENDERRFLVYGYFSSANPSAMARVFQAYQCRYAMLLDMNALEHTYLAIYSVDDTAITVQHLVKGMEEVDRTVRGNQIPRFIGYPDNRDFFYVMRHNEDEL